eukprot:s4336_g3.t1
MGKCPTELSVARGDPPTRRFGDEAEAAGSDRQRLPESIGAPATPVKGPLMLDETDKDPCLAVFEALGWPNSDDVRTLEACWINSSRRCPRTRRKRRKLPVTGSTRQVSQTLKKGFNSAANAVEGKADKTADEADDVAKADIKEKHEKGDAAPEKLLEQEKGTSPVLVLLPCLGLGVAAGVYLRRRASEDDELAPVYHMQASKPHTGIPDVEQVCKLHGSSYLAVRKKRSEGDMKGFLGSTDFETRPISCTFDAKEKINVSFVDLTLDSGKETYEENGPDSRPFSTYDEEAI